MAKKLYTGHPDLGLQFFETEPFVCTMFNVQCFRIRSVSYRVVRQPNGFAGKEPRREISVHRSEHQENVKGTPNKFLSDRLC